jgi:glycine dehydrogenase subunit 2
MGGPGSGPVGVKNELIKFLPKPVVDIKDEKYFLDYDRPFSIGRVKSFYGNFSVVVKAYTYILTMGYEGLSKASENAVLNANYMMKKLKGHYHLPYDKKCMHEFVISAKNQKDNYEVSALDIAKSLLDQGYHPPTIYFPLIVKEALMIEPTESEGKEIIDEFIETMIEIANMCITDPEKIKHSPYSTPVRRVDEVKAAKELILKWSK